jgi:ABC-type ATPase involved in cell division
VRDNLQWALARTGVPASECLTRADYVLAALGLSAQAGQFPQDLSPGECRLVAVARAIALRPQLLLLDDPPAEVLESLDDGLALLPDGTAIVVTSSSPPSDWAEPWQRRRIHGA